MIEQIRQGYVKTESEHGITTIEFFHPQSNSLPGKILETLSHEIHSEGHNDRTRIIILRSFGEKAFCAGASFEELTAIRDEQEGQRFFSGFAEVILAMRNCPKFILARIQGKCVGGGVGLAAAADYAIATEGADIKLSELALGIGPFVVGPAVERKIGLSAYSQLSIDAGMWRSGDWARRKGLFSELHPSVESMDDSLSRLATTLSHYSLEAMSELKKVLWEGTAHWEQLLHQRAALSGRLVLGEATRTYIREFLAKSKK